MARLELEQTERRIAADVATAIIRRHDRNEEDKDMVNLGSWEIDEIKAVNLPQKVASAFIAVTGDLVGADYMPVLYVGKQLVNGTNYCLIAVQTLAVPNSPKHLVKMIIDDNP
jgi:hypothetical protein